MLSDSGQNEAELLQVTVVTRKEIASDRVPFLLGCFIAKKEVEMHCQNEA